MGPGADSPCQGEMARRARGGRVGEYECGALILSRPRWRFAYFAATGKVGRRPEPHPIRAKRVSLTAKSRTFQFQFSIYQPLAPYFSR